MSIFALAVDDGIRRLLQAACRESGRQLLMVDSVGSARSQLDASFALAFIEVPCEGIPAPDVLAEIRRYWPDLKVALIARETLDADQITACQAHGVFAYLNGQPKISDLQGILGKAAGA